MKTVSDYSRGSVFNDRVMNATLLEKVYVLPKKTIDEGKALCNPEVFSATVLRQRLQRAADRIRVTLTFCSVSSRKKVS